MRKLAAAALSLALTSAVRGDALDAYRALRGASPDSAGVAVHGLDLSRDAARFHFETGEFHFLPGPGGRIFGAVFVGSGNYTITPTDPGESAHLAILLGDKNAKRFTDEFHALVLLFSDGTEAEIRAAGAASSAQVADAQEAYRKFGAFERREIHTNLYLPILDAIDGTPGTAGAFLAAPAGGHYPSMLFALDPAGLGHARLGSDFSGETAALYDADPARGGYWYVNAPRPAGAAPIVGADRYEIDTRIDARYAIEGQTTIHATASAAGTRVVNLHLAPKLRLTRAEIAPGGDAAAFRETSFIQEKAEDDPDAALVLAEPLPAGPSLIRLSYQGTEVLFNAGDGNFAVRSRESWYPNLGSFRQPAVFDLKYRVPTGLEIVSVGEKASETREGDATVSRWTTPTPVRVAGFNFGKFKKLERADSQSGVTMVVYTNPGTPDVITEINQALQRTQTNRNVQGLSSPIPGDMDNPYAEVPSYVGRQSVTIDTEGLADSAIVDGINTARVGAAYFGALSIPRIAITQQSQWTFGQSWPGLIYLPYLAFLDSGVRHELGLDRAKDFVDKVAPHEVAHQWWGHRVGWASYRDQWLSEGFAEFTAGLVLEKTGGPARARDYWEKARKFILETPHGSAIANCDAGPISLGFRLANSRTPEAYAAIVYSKGGFVLRMLRALMRDEHAPNPDHAFIDLMTDFASRFSGKNPSTADFQRVAETHMVPAMNATGNGKLDWFFGEWVDGTAIPRIKAKIDVHGVGGNKYEISGEIGQDSVPEDFRVLMPLYLDFGKGKIGKFAVVPLVGNRTIPIKATIELPQKPKAVVVNAMGEVLTRN